MRAIALSACAAFVLCAGPLPQAAAQPAVDAPPAGDVRIVWEVKNRFRLFRNEADFQRHVAAHRSDGVLGAERRLAVETDGLGWAKDMIERLCVDQTGKLLETCQRDGHRENYLTPQDHRVAVRLTGPTPDGASCAWSFDDGSGTPQLTTTPCEDDVKLYVRHGRPTIATVGIARADGNVDNVTTEIRVRDLLIAGLGDSVASGEGNPDRAVALADQGFCFRRFLGTGRSEYFRPSRAEFGGDKACDDTPGGGAETAEAATEWARHNARWLSAGCHRSLYSYQARTALAIAIENPHVAVTFLPLACSGASIGAGLFGSQRMSDCPPSGRCAGSAPGQIAELEDLLANAKRRQPDRALDLVLLTIGANDIKFSGLVADVIITSGVERLLFRQSGMMTTVAESQRLLDRSLPGDFAKLRTALKPMVGGSLSRVVYVAYGNPAQHKEATCAGGRDGFDVHPAFTVDAARLRLVADYTNAQFLPRLKSLARCEGSVLCRDPATERMTFVDGHQPAFAEHGVCVRSDDDPVFDRECFSTKGESFETDPIAAANAPLACSRRPSEFRPYASRARWIRTANDSYFAAMSFPQGLPSAMQPTNIHDAMWGTISAVYGGAVHPTAEGHAAMADAAMPAVRATLGLRGPPSVTAESLPLLPR